MVDINNILVVVDRLAKRNYFIPSYQRGYRWSKQQVTELLDDIYDFSENIGEQEYYCLQPIVVRKLNDEAISLYNLKSETNEEWYEVIDGQQRITTIALILHYFNESYIGKKKKPEPNIKYETRDTSIKEIEIDDTTQRAYCTNPKIVDNIDMYHAINAYQYIHDWFTQAELDVNSIMSVFNTKVKVIWYEVNETIKDGSDAIELFTRINMGKIPLTNAELIKALFLRQRNFDSNRELRQIEIAKEWDSIEYALQNDDIWYFLNKKEEIIPARIEFLFDMMYNKEFNLASKDGRVDDFNKLYGTDGYKTFRFFATKFKIELKNSVKDSWEEVQNTFSAIKEWFNDPIYYHYIGYLITCGISIVDIYTMYHNTPKDEFLKQLEDKIRETVKTIHYTIESNDIRFNLSYDSSNKSDIRKLLLLFNIQHIIVHNSQSEHWYMRFPFDLYKKQRWDIEHINSFTTNEITKIEDQITWIDIALEDLINLGINIEEKDTELYSSIEDFRRNQGKNRFLEIKKGIAKHAGEDVEETEDVKNSLGNLTLLNAEINRGYGNSLFVTKRKEIIKKDKEGCFIPICTKNIFLKYYDTDGSSKTIWSKGNGDYAKYLMEIKDTLKDFITKEDEQYESEI